MTAGEVAEKFPDEFAQWRTEPHAVMMPEGESLDDVARRVAAVFQRIATEHPHQSIAMISHDAVLRVFVLLALDLPLNYFWKWHFENAALTVLEATEPARRFRLVLLNDTTHLDGARSDHTAQAL